MEHPTKNGHLSKANLQPPPATTTMAEEAIDMADEAIEVIDVVDLTHSESDPPTPPTTFKMWLDICPMAKPSVRYGPGRGGHFRVFYDMGVTQAMADLRNTVQDEMTRVGMAEFPRYQPLCLKIWFFMKRPKSDFINRQRVAGRLKPSALADA